MCKVRVKFYFENRSTFKRRHTHNLYPSGCTSGSTASDNSAMSPKKQEKCWKCEGPDFGQGHACNTAMHRGAVLVLE